VDLLEFIASDERNIYIKDSGLSYYVRKSLFFPGVIELANCSALPGSDGLSYWRFLKKYESTIPFIAEQVLNPDLADLYRKRKWLEKDIGGIPQFASPLMVKQNERNERFIIFWKQKSIDFLS
jgi:hypothetical protein